MSYRAERPPHSTMVQYSSCEQASCFIFRRYRTTVGLSVTSHTSRSTFSEPITMPRQTPNQVIQLTVGQNKKQELESKHFTPLRLLHGAEFVERTKEIEILLDIAGEQKFLTHGLTSPAANFFAQFLVLEQSNNAIGGFFH